MTYATFMDFIGSFDAKTHLARLLTRVERGESFTITRRGRAVAKLAPVTGDGAQRRSPGDVVARFRSLRERIARDHGAAQLQRKDGGSEAAAAPTIRELINEGRKR